MNLKCNLVDSWKPRNARLVVHNCQARVSFKEVKN